MEELGTTKRVILSYKQLEIGNAESATAAAAADHPNPKIPRKRVISQTDAWNNTISTYSTQESQLLLLLQIQSGVFSEAGNILTSHLKTKQSGYRSQDTAKKIYEPERLIKIPELIALLIDSNLSCFYCKKWTTLFYDNVREPQQWSLERLSNSEGHNIGNVVIACLECNMRRRTMYYERYLATKQLKVNKITDET